MKVLGPLVILLIAIGLAVAIANRVPNRSPEESPVDISAQAHNVDPLDWHTEADSVAAETGADDLGKSAVHQSADVHRDVREQYQIYRGMSDADLKVLAAQADATALAVLGRRVQISDPSLAMKYFTWSAVYGSKTVLLNAAQVVTQATDRKSSSSLLRVSNRDDVSSLALYLAAQRRGENRFAPSEIQTLLASGNFADRAIRDACEGSRIIYEFLEQKRISVGHNYFDNSPNDSYVPLVSENPIPECEHP